MKARQKVKKKAASKDKVFGCDLLEHLHISGQEVPQVLKSCTEFVEGQGIVDGIYRLCGIASNVQKLRQEFDMERPPELNKDTYLQDVHCVSSLCKAYFRELPNPLLTYQLYDKFADAVALQLEEQRLVKIKAVLKELPLPHYRSKDIEASGFNGTAAFMEVRIQSIVVEFILTHVEQLFGDVSLVGSENEDRRGSLLPSAMVNPPACSPDDYFRSLSYNIPSMLNHGDGPPQMRPYHTIIEISEHKRKGSLKAKKWKSIFNLGRSNHDSKRKSNKHDDKDEKSGNMNLRPAKSMDSLSSAPYATDENSVRVRKRSPKNQLPIRRESFQAQSKQENSCTFLDTDEQSSQVETLHQNLLEYEEEATAKSEPTTPKPGRSSLVGNPQGRSPKTTQNRAEKCVGVHISGPFSVTLPFHITSNLSRLTRGMECPSLNYPLLHKGSEKSSSHEESPSEGSLDIMQVKSELVSENYKDKDEQFDIQTDTKEDLAPSIENTRISLEVQDTFSFLDNQDTNPEANSSGADQPQEDDSTCMNEDISGYAAGFFPVDSELLEDDLRCAYMSDIRTNMQVEEFSVEPPPDDLSTEEESDQMYFMPTGCVDIEEHTREIEDNLEDVYLSAYDDLSPLVRELEKPFDVLDTKPLDLSTHNCELEEVSSQHLKCENLSEALKEIKPNMDSIKHQELIEHDILDLCFPTDSGHEEGTQDNIKEEHYDQLKSPVDKVSLDNIEVTVINSEPGFLPEADDVKQDIVSHFDIEIYVMSDNVPEGPDQFFPNDAETTKYQGQTKEEDSLAVQTLMFHSQIECENDSQYPKSLSVEIDDTQIDNMLTPNTLAESQDECIMPAHENMLQRTDYEDSAQQNERKDCKPQEDNEISSVQEYSMLTVATFLNELENKPITGANPAGSVSMKLTTTAHKIQQVTSVPVVPPKPQFAKLHPALKSKIHVGSAFAISKDTRQKESERIISVETGDSCSDSLQKQRRSSWRSSGSVSFDTAVALAKERSQCPVRRMQTYSIGDSHDVFESLKVENALNLQKPALKPSGYRLSRPLSCVVSLNSTEAASKGNNDFNEAPANTSSMHGSQSVFSQEPVACTQELPLSNRQSMPRVGKHSDSEETSAISQKQRRSLL
ncbi:hypothetical protein FKM82_019510 [Ascaphus truei]